MSSVDLGPLLEDGYYFRGSHVGKGNVVFMRECEDIAFARYWFCSQQQRWKTCTKSAVRSSAAPAQDRTWPLILR